MKQISKILSILLAIVTLFSSCEKVVGEGPVVAQERFYSDFNALAISVSGTVKYTAGNEYRVIIHAQQNILDIIQTRVEGGELLIKFKDRKRVRAHEEIEIELVSPHLTKLDLSGSAGVEVEGLIAEDFLDLNLSGSGNITLNEAAIDGPLRANISGSGNIYLLGGSANSTRLKVSGSGNLLAEELVAVSSVADISGSGNIKLQATSSLEATISGSGSVMYRGSPQVIQHVSGSGTVRPL